MKLFFISLMLLVVSVVKVVGDGGGEGGGGIWATFHIKVPFLANTEHYPKLYEKNMPWLECEDEK